MRLGRRPAPPPLWRFDDQAAAAVEAAEHEARALGHPSVGSGHVLLALAASDTRAGAVLTRLGVDDDAMRLSLRERLGVARRPTLDPDALATLGIDLDEVRRRVEESFGAGALERAANGSGACLGVSPHLKQVYEEAARAAEADEQLVSPERLLLALVESDGGIVGRLLAAQGVDAAALRTAL